MLDKGNKLSFQIDDLPPKAIAMLDILWSCQTPYELHSFRKSLRPKDKQLCDTLITLVQHEALEHHLNLMEGKYPLVERLLDKLRNEV